MRRIACKLLKLNDLNPSQILLRRIGLLRRLSRELLKLNSNLATNGDDQGKAYSR
jgi:hypothetical protein